MIRPVIGTHAENIISDAGEHRRYLLDTMVRVGDGRASVPQANAIAALSAEVHKSIRLDWEMAQYAAGHLAVGANGRLLALPAPSGD